MREILFRGKRTDNGEWVEGYLHIKYFQELPHDRFVIEYESKNNSTKWQPKYMVAEIDPETIGEFTGLTDKNGTKIFEGDIVKWNINFAIVWQDCKFVIKKDINAKLYDYVLSCFDGTEFEVIGNIHDNPELLNEVEI